MAYDVYQDLLFVQGFSGGFLNRGIFLNPTIGTTGVGALGGVAQTLVTDQIWVGAMAFDANAKSAEFDLDTIREGEFLKSVEVGWTASRDRFKVDRAHLTFWEKDEREEAGATRGAGWVFSSSYEFYDGFIPFLRFGESNGGAGVAAERSAAAGFQLELQEDRIWSVGAMWAEPSSETYGPGLRDEYAIETSLQFRLSPNVSLMPDLQLLIDPAGAPDEDQVWVLGLRALLSL
jgi:porin